MLTARKRRRRFKVRTRTYFGFRPVLPGGQDPRRARHHRQAAHGLPPRRRLPPDRLGPSLRGRLPGEHGGHRSGCGPGCRRRAAAGAGHHLRAHHSAPAARRGPSHHRHGADLAAPGTDDIRGWSAGTVVAGAVASPSALRPAGLAAAINAGEPVAVADIARRRDEEPGHALACGPDPVGCRIPSGPHLEVRHRDGAAPPRAARQQVVPDSDPRARRLVRHGPLQPGEHERRLSTADTTDRPLIRHGRTRRDTGTMKTTTTMTTKPFHRLCRRATGAVALLAALALAAGCSTSSASGKASASSSSGSETTWTTISSSVATASTGASVSDILGANTSVRTPPAPRTTPGPPTRRRPPRSRCRDRRLGQRVGVEQREGRRGHRHHQRRRHLRPQR